MSIDEQGIDSSDVLRVINGGRLSGSVIGFRGWRGLLAGGIDADHTETLLRVEHWA